MNITDINPFTFILKLLPTSPFQAYIKQIGSLPYLKNLNWFVPVPTLIMISESWLVAIGLFYLYSIILRWIKAIQ